MTASLELRVANGAAWLDDVRPEWWTEIDLGRLEMENPCRCVLGQLVGRVNLLRPTWLEVPGFTAFERLFGLPWVIDHGFTYPNHREGRSWADLDDAWVAEIKARWEAGKGAGAVTGAGADG